MSETLALFLYHSLILSPRSVIKIETRRSVCIGPYLACTRSCRIRPVFNAFHSLSGFDPPLLSDLHLRDCAKWAIRLFFSQMLQPLSDVPERHLGFPWTCYRSLGDRSSIVSRNLVTTTVDHQIHSVVNNHTGAMRLALPSWEPLLMRPDTGVPVSALWRCS